MKYPIPQNDITYDSQLFIQELQHYLRIIDQEKQGYSDVPADGFFGSNTTAAVKRSQSAAGLPQTGIADLATWEAIHTSSNNILRAQERPISTYMFRRGQEPMRCGRTGDEVDALQIMLGELCRQYINLPFCSQSGVYDEATAAAVSRLQLIADLPITGVVDKETWDIITRLYNLD